MANCQKQFPVVTTVARNIETILVFQFVGGSDPRLPKYIMKWGLDSNLTLFSHSKSYLTTLLKYFHVDVISTLKRERNENLW